jgi:hypothetical protein
MSLGEVNKATLDDDYLGVGDFTAGACIIKHYGFVIYRKWTDFIVS